MYGFFLIEWMLAVYNLVFLSKNSSMEYVVTGDGSKTLYNEQIGEHYHSKHGALQEAKHVFLKSGLEFSLAGEPKDAISILEIGFGTGLNFLLTADYCISEGICLDYCGIEGYPLADEVIAHTGYDAYVGHAIWTNFKDSYHSALQERLNIHPQVSLQIAHQKVLDFNIEKYFDIIYFDAFAAIHQPEMWTDETLAHVTGFLKTGGVFVTYAITGNLKRSMKALGFTIEKAPGAPGKREMLRAVKL